MCGVDASRSAAGAVRVARTLSDCLRLRLVLVHVTDVPVVSPMTGFRGAHAELRAIALDAANELLDWVCETEDLPEVVRRVELGKPAKRLAAVSDEEKAELLVVGSRGRGRLTSALLGSVSADVARTARCPVAIIPERAAGSAPRQRPTRAWLLGPQRSWPSEAQLENHGRA